MSVAELIGTRVSLSIAKVPLRQAIQVSQPFLEIHHRLLDDIHSDRDFVWRDGAAVASCYVNGTPLSLADYDQH